MHQFSCVYKSIPEILNKIICYMTKSLIKTPDLIFIILLVVLTSISFISYIRIKELNTASDLVYHTNQVNLKLNEVLVNLTNAETGQRGYLLTMDSSFLIPYQGSNEKVKRNISEIDSLVSDNLEQKKNLKTLSFLIDERFRLLDKNLQLNYKQAIPATELMPILEKGKAVMDQVRKEIASMMSHEKKLLQIRIKDKNHTAFITPIYYLLFTLIALIIVTVAYYRLRAEMQLRFMAQANEAKIQQLQLATKESEIHFKNIADNVPVLIWLSDTEKLCYYFNKGWLEFTGRTIEQETGNGWAEGIYPEDVENCLTAYNTSADARQEFYMEYRLKRHDGVYRWISHKGVPRYTAGGTFIGYAGGCMDIQEQKNFAQELEKKVAERTIELKKLNDYLQLKNNIFAHAEENAMAGSYSWNLQTNDLEYSDNLFRMLGCEPQEFVPSFEKFLNFIHPDDIELVVDDGQKTFENQMIVQHIYRVITKTGTIKFFRSSGNFTGEGDNRFMVGSVQDVTKDTLMNEVLTKKNLELKHNNAELESFTYIASHDLQEPLRKIQSFSKLILTKELANLSATSNDYFSRIIAAAQRMQHLIDALLNYSSSNSLDNQSLPTDLNGIIDEVIYNLNDIIEEKKAMIEKADLPKLNVVQVQFYQLFSNIISNALKYSRPHIVPLIKISANIIAADEIKTGTTDKKGKYWKITIADNGIGFDQQYEFKIFELFQRLHGRNEYEGTGIGLAICNKIVHNHNGFIMAAGHPGVGAEFTIYLPIAN